MELVCPDCRGELQISNGRMASCPLHGGAYEILFDREGESVRKTAERPEDGKTCEAHPRQAAVADCTACGKTLCGICSFDVGDRHYCGDCAVNGANAAPSALPEASPPAAPAGQPDALEIAAGNKECPMCGLREAATARTCASCGHVYGLLNLSPGPRRRSVPVGLKCPQHLEVDAIEQCRGCSNGVCATCDFEMPGGLHFCPACVDNAGSEEISPKRKKLAIAAIVLAAYCTGMYLFMITGALYRALGSPTDVQTLGCMVMLLLYAPSVLGTAFAATARDRRLRNTTMIWIALVWNVVIITVLGIQFAVGTINS
jgi:hypothetical protein